MAMTSQVVKMEVVLQSVTGNLSTLFCSAIT